MRILLINTVGSGYSTGRTVQELANYLVLNGNECQCISAFGEGDTIPFEFRIEKRVHSVLSHFLGLEGYYSFFSTIRLDKIIEKYHPDIVHIFVIHSHIICFKKLFNKLADLKISVVLNFDDFWWMTGKCTHFEQYNCSKYISQCNNCPAQHDSPNSFFFDFSKKMFCDKDNCYSKLNKLETICVSKYVGEKANKSYIFKKYKNNVIYNWIDMKIFYPRDLSKKSDIANIICVSSSWLKNSEKGIKLHQLINLLPKNIELTVVGEHDFTKNEQNIHFVGKITNTEKLALLYSTADVYVHLSSFETFGKVVAEAMACGIPVVAFKKTALAELIDDSVGVACEGNDVKDLVNGIQICLSHGKNSYKDACVKRARQLFNINNNISKILNVYNECIINKEREI